METCFWSSGHCDTLCCARQEGYGGGKKYNNGTKETDDKSMVGPGDTGCVENTLVRRCTGGARREGSMINSGVLGGEGGRMMRGEETAEMDGEAQRARERERECAVIQSYYEEAEKAPLKGSGGEETARNRD